LLVIGRQLQTAVVGQYVAGSKGTMSELELSLFRQRSQEALKQKACRGALVLGVAAGYVKIGRDCIERNPDKRVQDALQLVFHQVRRAAKCTTGAHLAERGGHRAARQVAPR
jgi:hypothetical protein